MKKQFFSAWKAAAFALLLLFLISLQAVQAQNKTWGAGPEIGMSFAKYSGDLENQEFKTGLLGGGHVTYSTHPTFGVTLKALYHQRGSQQEIGGTLNKELLHYLEFPLLARYFLTPGGKFRPNIFLGPSAAFLLNVQNKVGDGAYTSVSAENRENYRNFDLGLNAGIGLNYLIAKETRLLFDARYTHGLTDLTKAVDISTYNRGWAFTLGLSFGLTKQPL
jgi:outer membrane protein W